MVRGKTRSTHFLRLMNFSARSKSADLNPLVVARGRQMGRDCPDADPSVRRRALNPPTITMVSIFSNIIHIFCAMIAIKYFLQWNCNRGTFLSGRRPWEVSYGN